MAKNLSERIAIRAIEKKPFRSARNRAAFLALRVDIKQALDDGWPVKSIWETLHAEGKVDFSYQAFRCYTNRLILKPLAEPNRAMNLKPNAEAAKTHNVPEPKTTTEPGHVGFTFNPMPKKEDLF